MGRILEAAGAVAIRFEEGVGPAFYDEGVADEPRYWPTTRVVAFFISQAALDFACFVLADLAEDMTCSTAADEGWERAVLADWHPQEIQSNFWIYPSHLTAPSGRRAVYLDPGLAFGTGTHPTTQLCLQWIHTQTTERNAINSVLDWGCGSGILAITALVLGARQATGLDIDPLALTASRDNARRNGVEQRLTVHTPPAPAALFDLVIANILAGPLIALAPMLNQAACAHLALSGILEEQAEQVINAFPGWRFIQHRKEGWVLLAGTRS